MEHASNPAPLLDVADLHAGYGRAEVLAGIGLRLGQGQVVTVIGPNGAGKSTLLNALMGVIGARGRLRFDGRDIGSLELEARVGLGLALVPEKRELFTTMPVEDNLLLGAYRHRSLGAAVRRQRIEQVYALFPRLAERRAQLAGTLSGGERQMLALGRALMGEPRLLMLDEPSLGLAPLVVRDIFRAIAQLRAAGVSILLVEQNARAALEVADYAYVLETGAVALEGPAAQLAGDRRLVDTYLGSQRSAATAAEADSPDDAARQGARA
jgi:branched-chain amino acid transport system ATP-binding protein